MSHVIVFVEMLNEVQNPGMYCQVMVLSSLKENVHYLWNFHRDKGPDSPVTNEELSMKKADMEIQSISHL